jgi:signal transduction histidine kinase/ligand-binding sensor domain-containing protein
MPGLLAIGTWRTSGVLISMLVCILPSRVAAEKLPATIYTTGQGLAHNSVQRVLPDSRGFIWFATREGLSRFDGYTFTNYGVGDGLPSPVINDILETRDGVYLVATAAGLARLEMNARPKPAETAGPSDALFSVHQISSSPGSRQVLTLYEDRRGTVWVGTRAGLFALDNAAGAMTFRPVPIGSRPSDPPLPVWSLREDRFGALWVGTSPGARRLWPDGRIDALFLDVEVQAILEDRAGRLWLGTRSHGLVELTFDGTSGAVATKNVHTAATGLPTDWINALFEPHAGELWAGSPVGLVQILQSGAAPPAYRLLTQAHGLGRGEFQSLTADRAGNFWAGTKDGGAVKIARSGFSTFGAEDGLPWAASLVQARSGDVCFAGETGTRGSWGLHCFNGSSFDRVPTALDTATGAISWGWKQIVLEDRAGDWWFGTRNGIARFRGVRGPRALTGHRPLVWYTRRDGLTADVILALFEDSRGDVWIGAVVEGARSGVSRWERSTNTLHHYVDERQLPDLNAHYPTVFTEDRSGAIWIGFSGAGGIARYRNGRFERVGTPDVRAMVRDAFRDASGRLWFATYDGLFRVDDPAAASPVFARYGTSEGLSSNETSALAADVEGRLYVATARGLDRMDPTTGRIKHFSTNDGVPVGAISAALLDARSGHLWFAHRSGVSRLIPPAGPSGIAPPIVITAVHVDSEAQPLAPLGERTVPALELTHDRNDLRVDYVALGFGPGEDLRYQYRLEGAQDEWSTPSNQRTVNFANLAPGHYRFVVRAISADGIPSPEAASIAFIIVPPVWQRGWFLALALVLASLAVYALYRYRLRRAVELATMRTRIATDLHDDLGASLSHVSILSEVIKQRLHPVDDVSASLLGEIADSSRRVVGSIRDTVWAIDARHGTVGDLAVRVRQFASTMFDPRGITWRLDLTAEAARLVLDSDHRRHLLLFFKEAINNIARHADCRSVQLSIAADRRELRLQVRDDGRGFDVPRETAAAAARGSRGLENMSARAAALGGHFETRTAPGQGTILSLTVPLKRRARGA